MNTVNDKALRAFSGRWELDGDLMKCRECGRGLIASRDNEELNHRSGCKNGKHASPWNELRRAMR